MSLLKINERIASSKKRNRSINFCVLLPCSRCLRF